MISKLPSRRSFLSLAAASLATTALPRASHAERLGGDVFSRASLGAYQSGQITPENLARLLGSTFMVFLDARKVAYLTLTAVTAHQPQLLDRQAALDVQRALQGTASPLASLGQGTLELTNWQASFQTLNPIFPADTYLVDHGRLGRFAMTLAFSKPGLCHACFSALAPGSASAVTAPIHHLNSL